MSAAARFIRGSEYKDERVIWIDFFKNNFTKGDPPKRPHEFDYRDYQIPHSDFSAVDVYGRNGQFLARYLILVVRNGDKLKNTPESYRHTHIHELDNLGSPVSAHSVFSKGIAILFVDEDNNFQDIALGHDLLWGS